MLQKGAKKINTIHFLSLISGWLCNWGLGAQIYMKIVLRKRIFIFLIVFEVELGLGRYDGVKSIRKGS